MKTGLFFGSFNPVHHGHLAIAQYILNETALEQILFVVSPRNPLKDENKLIPATKRLEMVQLSIADNPRFRVTDIEFGLEKPSYTYQTLRALKMQYPNDEFSILMGSDTLEQLPLWKYPGEILAYPIIVYKRSEEVLNPYKENPSITILEAPLLDISATAIRNMLDQNKDIKYLVRDEIINLLKNS
jgi:nicotinate-nucleotide adenylyltransferase